MRFGNVLAFRNDLFFDGAVQADWFYQADRAKKVAESFVFHGREYFGVAEDNSSSKLTDTASFVRAIAEKVSAEQYGNPFTLAIAGYGTGKSHLAVTLAQILSGHEYMSATHKRIMANIKKVDAKTFSIIDQYTKKPNLVLAINGMRDFNLHYEILRTAEKSLNLYGVSTESLRKLNRAHETALRFLERNAVSNVSSFELKARQRGWLELGEHLIQRIHASLGQDEVAFSLIDEVYEEFNGHKIRWDEGVSAGAVLETLVSEYCGMGGQFERVILIFDEFGRYLEYASANGAHSGDSALQQIFEAAQNAEGDIQIINFIQSDIRTYLQRVDQTSNISRYIGRYDVSEKYYLSSNLETVFANLIERKDQAVFDEVIKIKQLKEEDAWLTLYNNLNRWLPLKGVWKDYKLFRQVVVEGIYPMHPVATCMLTRLSDYMQNRSSLMLMNRQFEKLAELNVTLKGKLPIVMPVDLLEGDLFSELLSAEQEGRQLSQHCIRYQNVMRKNSDKLTQLSIKVLQANLIMRIMRFSTTSYDDAKTALLVCSGITDHELDTAIELLENEYALIGFDERAGCFDFMEDSTGAHDFKTFMHRRRVGISLPASIFDDSTIREFSGVLTPIPTNFGSERKIKSNEWQFEQEVFPLQDLSSTLLTSRIVAYKQATTPEKIKGRLIWLYVNRDTNVETLDKVQELSKATAGMPIILMLLNDVEGKLHNVLLDYHILSAVPDSDRKKYHRHFDDALEQACENARTQFDNLKKERIHLSENGSIVIQQRLGIYLNEVFKAIYPYAIPFDFDGFEGRQPGRARKSYCSILRLLLSGNINESTIQGFPVDVRNRFEAILYDGGVNSWKAVNKQYSIVPPREANASRVYNNYENLLRTHEKLECKAILEELCAPPYGMNEYAAIFMVAVLCANLSYCIRPNIKNEIYSVNNWKELVVEDSKINVGTFQNTILMLVDAGKSNDEYRRLFKEIEDNTEIDKATSFKDKLRIMQASEEVPIELDAQLKLSMYRLDEGERTYRNWLSQLGEIQDKVASAQVKEDVFMALSSIQKVDDMMAFSVPQGYVISEKQREKLELLEEKAREYAEPRLVKWLGTQVCQSVPTMGQYEKHMKRLVDMLEKALYHDEARVARSVCQKELDNIAIIKMRQELKGNCEKFLNSFMMNNHIAYTTLLEWTKQGKELISNIRSNQNIIGADAVGIEQRINRRISEFEGNIEATKNCMDSIWNDIYELEDSNAIRAMITRINDVCLKGIAVEDRKDFEVLRDFLSEFIKDVALLGDLRFDRNKINDLQLQLMEKYSDDDQEIDLSSVLQDILDDIITKMDDREVIWIQKYIKINPDNMGEQEIYAWKQQMALLPEYLSESVIKQYKTVCLAVNNRLSAVKLKYILKLFMELSKEEQKTCLGYLQK